MSCLCSKLREKSYAEITADEIDLLTRTLREAPQLFSIATDLEPRNKRKRGQNPPNPSSDAVVDLVSSYPDKTFQELLANHGEQWLSEPIGFLKHWDIQHSDIVVNIYSSINRIETSDGVTKLLKRIYCYALTELHEKGTRIDDMLARILDTKEFRAIAKSEVKEEIYRIFKIGSRWKQIIQFCGKLLEEDPGKVSGVIWLLGKGYAWERASAKVCEQAIADIGPQSDLFIEARKYSSSVNIILGHLKKETVFLPSRAHVSPQERTSSPPSSALGQDSSHECDKNAIGLVPISNFCLRLPSCDVLRSFYLKRICASRTLFEHNLYLDMFQASQKSKSLEAALFSLSSLYLETNESRMYRQSALGFLREELKHRDSCPIRECLGTILLLLQFTILSEECSSEWYAHAVTLGPILHYAIPFPGTLGYRMKIASHCILANATAIQNERFPAVNFLSRQEKEIERVDALCGLSPQLLSIIQEINNFAVCQYEDADVMPLLASLQGLCQICLDEDIAEKFRTTPAQLQKAKADATITAESYQLSTILYFHYRILRTPITNKILEPVRERLLAIFKELRPGGPYYKAIWPLWPLFIYSISIASKAEAFAITNVWDELDKNSSRSNLPPVVRAARKLLQTARIDGQQLWWETRIRACGRLRLT